MGDFNKIGVAWLTAVLLQVWGVGGHSTAMVSTSVESILCSTIVWR